MGWLGWPFGTGDGYDLLTPEQQRTVDEAMDDDLITPQPEGTCYYCPNPATNVLFIGFTDKEGEKPIWRHVCREHRYERSG